MFFTNGELLSLRIERWQIYHKFQPSGNLNRVDSSTLLSAAVQRWHNLVQKSIKFIFQNLIPFGLSGYWYRAFSYVNMFQHVSEAVLITYYLKPVCVIGPFVTTIVLFFSPPDSDWLNINRFGTSSLAIWIFQESWDSRSLKMIQLTIQYMNFFQNLCQGTLEEEGMTEALKCVSPLAPHISTQLLFIERSFTQKSDFKTVRWDYFLLVFCVIFWVLT